MSAGIRSGVNWMRLNVEVEDLGERLDQQRLGQPGHAGDQAVAAGEQRDQHLIDDLVLADDDLAQLGEDAVRGRSATRSALLGDVGRRCVRLQDCAQSGASLSGSAQ